MAYDDWLCAEHEKREEQAARLEGITEAYMRELQAGELDVMDCVSNKVINALFKVLCAIAYKDAAPAIRINEIQLALGIFAEECGMTHAAEAKEVRDWHTGED